MTTVNSNGGAPVAPENHTPTPSIQLADRLHAQLSDAYSLADALKWLANALETTHGTGPVFILEGLSEKAAALARNLEALRGDLPEVSA